MAFIDERLAVDPAFIGIMGELAEATGAKLTDTRIRVYARLLSDLTLEQIREAAAIVGRTTRALPGMLPTVPELRAAAMNGSVDDAALLAWNTLCQAVVDIGSYESPRIADPLAIAALIQTCGSWPEFCAIDEGPELTLRRSEFLAAYRQASLKAERLTTRELLGLTETKVLQLTGTE